MNTAKDEKGYPMKIKHLRGLFLILLIALISLACLAIPGFGDKKNSESEAGPVVEETAEAAAAEEEDQPAVVSEDETERVEEYIYGEGGFKFMPIADWETSCVVGIVQMKAPSASADLGPGFMIMAGENDQEMTTDAAFEKFKAESTGSEIGKARKVKVGGFPALQAELTSQQNGEEVKAVVITSMLTSKRQFTMMAMAPADRWDVDVAPYFEDVRDSIQFIDIDPTAGCPGDSSPATEPLAEATVEPEEEAVSNATQDNDGLLHQWAVGAKASSQYGDPEWAASQAVGEPNVPDCEDSIKAWASFQPDTEEWLELRYETPVYPTEINIHMNYNPSQVVEVQIIDTQGKTYTVIEADPEVVPFCPDVYTITLELTKKILVDRVKIFVDQRVLGLGWNEVDAVELVGTPEGGAVLPSKPGNTPSETSPGLEPPYAPEDLDPGAYSFAVTGYEETLVMSGNVQYQSIDVEYVVGLLSKDERYIISLFLPKKGLKQGKVPMRPYDNSVTPVGPSAAIYINAFLYVADEGEFNIQKDPATGKFTGTFSFKAHSKDFADRFIEVAGSLNQVPLK